MKRLMILAALALVATFSTVTAADDDNWILRFGFASVSPNDDSGPVLGGDGISVGDDAQFAFNLTYMLDDNWGIEVLGAHPFSHSLSGNGSLAGLPLGNTKHLPPTFSAVYYFDTEGDTKYHLGAGINYTKFFEDYPSDELRAALAVQDLDLSSSTGLALKAGFDTPIGEGWSFNGGLYYIMIETDADIIIGGSTALTVPVDINPWVIMLGIGTTF